MFYHSLVLLSLLFVSLSKYDLKSIKEEISKITEKSNELSTQVYQLILSNNLSNLREKYKSYQNYYFIYDITLNVIPLSNLDRQKTEDRKVDNAKLQPISSEFYEGFGIDLLNN